MGRQSTFNEKDAAEIVSRLSKGEPLTIICSDDWLPHDNTVRAWAEARPEFAVAIARAREAGFDAIALEALAIADHTAGDTKWVGAEGEERPVPDSEWISRSKLRVETRLKLLAKWDPKRYGDKIAHVGGDATDPAIKTESAVTIFALPDNGRK